MPKTRHRALNDVITRGINLSGPVADVAVTVSLSSVRQLPFRHRTTLDVVSHQERLEHYDTAVYRHLRRFVSGTATAACSLSSILRFVCTPRSGSLHNSRFFAVVLYFIE